MASVGIETSLNRFVARPSIRIKMGRMTFPPPNFGIGFAGNDLSLVGIVVQDYAELIEIFPAKRPADRLCNTIGDTVGMTEAFALDEFNPLFFQRNLVQCFNLDISLH